MDCQVDKKSHFRHLLLLAFNRGQKANEATRDICAVYGEDAIERRYGEKPKPRIKKDLHPMKTMICVWWDWEGLIHWEMLGKNMTVEKNINPNCIESMRQFNKKKCLKDGESLRNNLIHKT